MKIYTKTGDKGQTSLVGGERVDKHDDRLEAYGTIDELNASIGAAISSLPESLGELSTTLITIQNHLLDIGSELASLSIKKTPAMVIPQVKAAKIDWLEAQIDQYDQELTKLTQFILPGGSQQASFLHVARTVCRRAERLIVGLTDNHSASWRINPELIRYLNRLSDLLFTLARAANARQNIADTLWQKDL